MGLTGVGCDGGTPIDGGDRDGAVVRLDGGASADSGTTAGDGGTAPSDGGTTPTDGGGPGPSCTPTSGGATASAYCDLFQLAVMDDGSGAATARLSGRLTPDGLTDGGCATVDSIEVQEGGATIGTLDGVGAFETGSQNAVLARTPALPEMKTRCEGDANRFGGFGFIIRGRMDGGTFEAHCADAEGGGRWPPALVVSCHQNVDEPPFSTYVSVEPYDTFTFTTIDVTAPHGPGGALTSVDGTVHVIAGADPWSGGVVPDPFDITGVDGSTSEGSAPLTGAYSDLSLSTMGDPFRVDLCPVGWDGTGPEPDPPPVMLLRITGTGARGPFSTEAYVDDCTRVPSGP